jgi:hypothetical protein
MPQVKNLFTVIAREVTTDANDNMTSIIKLIEQFNFGYNPAELKEKGVEIGTKEAILFSAKYAVATSWFFDEKLKADTSYTFRISVIDQAGENRGGPSQEHVLPAGINRANMNFGVEGLPVSGAGDYTLRAELIDAAGKVLASGEYPFIVELNEE